MFLSHVVVPPSFSLSPFLSLKSINISSGEDFYKRAIKFSTYTVILKTINTIFIQSDVAKTQNIKMEYF